MNWPPENRYIHSAHRPNEFRAEGFNEGVAASWKVIEPVLQEANRLIKSAYEDGQAAYTNAGPYGRPILGHKLESLATFLHTLQGLLEGSTDNSFQAGQAASSDLSR